MSDGGGNAPRPGDPAAGAATTAFPLMITSGGVPLAARVHRRAGTSLFERQPAVVVTGSWLNVKEQWGTGTQTDFYDRPEQVALATEALVAHFTATLGPTTPAKPTTPTTPTTEVPR